ncbi:uncharacterized protein G2W53_027490 [Senna tora]|uniref:DUF3741 domain-containing protein n=1 Tax=Senna tora TaxID=362788 RepID=A0A834WG35_9FABA|nr:uncharacterized protein G2W53_027490 [Senna tora]
MNMMAKRSDFAQKLLDDLHLRKERMASSHSQSSTHIDAYAYTKQTYRGSRNVKASETVSSRTGDMLNSSSRSHRSAMNIGEASNQIVAYGRDQNTVQLSDMSLAMAYAFENGGKLTSTDSSFTTSVIGFLHQMKRGTMEYSKMERGGNFDRQVASTSNFPTLSPAHVNAISKGAQKLNHILRACSDGSLSMDRYSIEFAKQLLQGAMDLEESLRMLVDLDRSSESMKTSQKKNRITLLEEDENDDDGEDDERTITTSEQKPLARLSFSFDRPSRHSHNLQEKGNTNLMQSPHALTSSKEHRNLDNEKQDVNTSKLLSHKRSTSYSFDNKNLNALLKQKSQLAPKQSTKEKARIPNVIARLMGLDNLPEKVELGKTPQKDSGSTQKIQEMTFKHTATGNTKKTQPVNKQTENLVPQKKQKVTEPIDVTKTQEKELIYGADKKVIIQKAISEVADHNEKTPWRDLNEIKASKGLEKGTIKVDKQRDSATQMNIIRESRKDAQVNGRRQNQTTHREQKGTVKGRTDDLLLINMLSQLEQADERSEVDSSFQEEKESTGSALQFEKKQTNKHNVSNQKKSPNHLAIQQPNGLLKYGSQEVKYQREKLVHHSEEKMLQGRQQKGSEATAKNPSKYPHDLNNSQKQQPLINQATSFKPNFAESIDAMKSDGFLNSHYDQNRDEASNEFDVKVKEMINRKPSQITSPINRQSEAVKGRHAIVTMMDENSVHKLANKMVKNTRKKKSLFPEKTGEVLTRRNGTMLHSTKHVEQQSLMLQELKQRTSNKFNFSNEAEQERVSMLKEADALVISSNESIVTIEPLDVRRQPDTEVELPSAMCMSDGVKVQSRHESADLASNHLYQDGKLVSSNDKQNQATPMAAYEEFRSCEIAPNTINGFHKDKMDIKHHSQLHKQRVSQRRIQEPLTESENFLKWILVMSQPFLNTAEALFGLNIPFSILQGGDHQDNQDGGSKLILDCGYEVMKRKGIRQELKVHPCSKISITSIKIRSLDDLVRQLNEDLEKLKFYGRNRASHVDIEEYLPKMLENDVYNKYPDIDSMWDLGWNDDSFAFLEKYHVIRDIEKHILNELLDETTCELLNLQRGLTMTITY